VFVADVSGHGLPAAMIASITKIILGLYGGRPDSPGQLLAFLNEQLVGKTADNFLTGFFGILSPDFRYFTFATAGHPLPLLLRNGSASFLSGTGKLLGLFPNVSFQSDRIELFSGDRLILFTDGLTEASDRSGRLFDSNGLTHAVENSAKQPIGVQLHQLVSDAREFQGIATFEDDITLIGIDIE